MYVKYRRTGFLDSPYCMFLVSKMGGRDASSGWSEYRRLIEREKTWVAVRHWGVGIQWEIEYVEYRGFDGMVSEIKKESIWRQLKIVKSGFWHAVEKLLMREAEC